MADAKRDNNQVPTLIAVSSADGITPVVLWADPITHRLLTSATGGVGTVTSVAVVTAQGVSGVVANPTTAASITLTLGALTGITSVNGLVITANTGVITTGTWNGTTIAVANGGTGITSFGAGIAAWLGTPSSANLATAITDETGSGALVFATSPTLVTPALGVPSSVTLTNATGLPIAGITGLATGMATFFATPSSANLAATVTDETGSGALVFATSPTLVTPALGTPSSVTLTNGTGLPIAGIASLGTGVGTWLATPSSANLAAAITDETGTGALVFGTNPTIVKPVMNATNPTAQTYSPAGAGTATLDLSLANQHYITMPAGNITIALSNDTNNQIFYVSILQDATGGRTVTWFTTIRWVNAFVPVLTTTASKRDAFLFVRTGSGTYDGFILGQSI